VDFLRRVLGGLIIVNVNTAQKNRAEFAEMMKEIEDEDN
jgi:hypothetical protein